VTEAVERGRKVADLLEHRAQRNPSEVWRDIRSWGRNLRTEEFFQGVHRLRSDTIPEPHMAVRTALSTAAGLDAMTSLIDVAIMAGNEAELDTTAGWTTTVDLPSFRAANILVPEDVPRPGRLGRGGTAPHVTMTATDGTWRLQRYALQLAIAEEDLRDTEHFDVFSEALNQLGRAFGRIRADLVYSLLLNGAATTTDGVAIFDAAHGNTGTAALAGTSLDDGLAAIAGQVLTDEVGRAAHINLTPRYLIVPPALLYAAKSLAKLLQTGDGADLVVRSESRLSASGVYDPAGDVVRTGSATNWLLAAPATQRPSVLVGGLDGRVKPQLRTSRLDEGQWGVHVDATLDIGVTAADYRGLYWSTGAA
jgi:hypothetical protein